MIDEQKQVYEFDEFRLDTIKRQLTRSGEVVPLYSKAFDLLLVLVEKGGSVLTKDELLDAVWPGQILEEANLTVTMSVVRKALGEKASQPRYIVTIPGRGYRFVVDLRKPHEGEGGLLIESKTISQITVEEIEAIDGKAIDVVARTSWPGADVQPAKVDVSAMQVAGSAQLKQLAAGSSQNTFRRGAVAGVLICGVLLLGIAGGAWLLSRKKSDPPPAGVAQVKTMAVLPFQPINADSRDEFLELGMADALITKLSNLEQVVVRPTSAVRKYVGLSQDPVAAGKELRVDAVLVGNVQKSGDTLRATVQLINVGEGRSLWSETFDVKFTDIFAVQDSISEKVTSALALQMTSEERARLARRYTQDSEAYQLHQKGRYFLEAHTEESIRKALVYFQQATEKDPNYALAYAGLGESYVEIGTMALTVSQKDVARARVAAERAVALDDSLAEAHGALGIVQFDYYWDWKNAEREFQRAIQLNPNDRRTRQNYGFLLLAAGRSGEGLTQSRRAAELDPLSLHANTELAIAFIGARQYDDALAQLNKVFELDPNYFFAQITLGRAYVLKGMYQEAIAQYQKASSAGGGGYAAAAGLAEAYAFAGRRAEAQKILEGLTSQSGVRTVTFYYVAIVQTALGEHDKAFESLEKAFANHELGMLYLKAEGRLDGLRSDPRFTALIHRVGIPS